MQLALIFDCGATNLRTIAIDDKGKIIAFHHLPNNTQMGQENPDYHIWDFAEICTKLTACAKKTLADLTVKGISLDCIKGIGVTTFGVDGAPFDKNGKQLYPIISWKCPRTVPVMQNVSQYIDIEEFYQRNGIGLYSFNTLFKLIWLKENHPKVFAEMDKWVFISSMLNQFLTGEFTTDRTMAGTSMMTNLATADWDNEVLQLLGLSENHFPPLKSAGEKIGMLSDVHCRQLGLSPVPVISCGHDTQFAVFGSGAGLNQPVLSSGTWEILMARTQSAKPHIEFVAQGLTTELDAQAGCFNPAVQWIGSGIIEWIGKLLFRDVYDTDQYYATMIAEGHAAAKSAVGFQGVFSRQGQGNITGLSMFSTRGEIYRAALEYMAYQLKNGLNVLQQVSCFQVESLICVGGGSKNALWNQIRADVLGVPLDIVDIAESTVLGAAMFVFAGVGTYSSAEEAQQSMQPHKKRIYPSHLAIQ